MLKIDKVEIIFGLVVFVFIMLMDAITFPNLGVGIAVLPAILAAIVCVWVIHHTRGCE